jgi:hypothetical protein
MSISAPPSMNLKSMCRIWRQKKPCTVGELVDTVCRLFHDGRWLHHARRPVCRHLHEFSDKSILSISNPYDVRDFVKIQVFATTFTWGRGALISGGRSLVFDFSRRPASPSIHTWRHALGLCNLLNQLAEHWRQICIPCTICNAVIPPI